MTEIIGIRKEIENEAINHSERFFVADVNGDGKQDVIVKYRNDSTGCVNFKTYVGTATGNMMPSVSSVLTGVQFFDCET